MMKIASKETFDKLGAVEKEYLEKFGTDSLERVILGEPMDLSEEAITASIKLLKEAIANDDPLPQTDEETWEHIYF